jgi:hypothetical protein
LSAASTIFGGVLAGRLAAFEVLEAEMEKRVEAAQEAQRGASFAEFHFINGSVCGVIKTNNVVLKVEG